MASQISSMFAGVFQISSNQTLYVKNDATSSLTAVTVPAGYYAPYLVNSASADGTESNPWCSLQKIREICSNYFIFSLESNGHVKITYNGLASGEISFVSSSIVKNMLGFNTASITFTSGSSNTATYQPYGAVFTINRANDQGWNRTLSQGAYQELPNGNVYGWSDGYVKSTKKQDLRFLPTDQSYKDTTGSPATPCFPVTKSEWMQPALLENGYTPPFTFSHFLYMTPGKPVRAVHSTFQSNVSGSDTSFEVVYIRPDTINLKESFVPSIKDFRSYTDFKNLQEILSSSGTRQTYTVPTIASAPNSIDSSNIFAWYRADTLEQSSNAISKWTDVSGRGRHITQSTAAAKPTYSSSDISYNSQPIVSFDGGDNLDITADATFNLAQPFTAYLVAEVDKDAASYATYFDSTTANRVIYRIDTTITASNIYAGSTLNPTGSIDRRSKKVSCVVFNKANTKYYSSGASGPLLIGSGNIGTDFLGRLRVGYGNAGLYPFIGKMAELIFYSGSHDTSTITSVLDYLDDKYWSPSDIPGMHAWWSARSVTTADGLISQVNDLSGREKHLIQSTETRQPTYLSSVSGLNNKPAILFNGAQKLETSATHSMPRAMTVFFVLGNISSRGMILEHGLGSSLYYYSTGNAAVAVFGSSGVGYHRAFQNPRTTWMQEYEIACATYDQSSAPVLIGGNNTTLSTTSTDGVAQSNALAAYWYFGGRQDNTLFHTGMVAEVIVYERALTSAERARVYAYLQGLYGIQ
jgi:hypothetical protein